MVAVIIIVLLIAGYIGYTIWLKHGVRPRVFHTTLTVDQVRAVFLDKVVRAGWQLVDDGNPMVAQSSLVTGTRQQIGLTTASSGGGLRVDIRPLRMRVKVLTRVPTKGHTLRIRMNSFVSGVRALDPSVDASA